jgi:hypothetical protein
MRDKILDQQALFGALSMIFVCLAAAFWLFACVRLFRRRAGERPESDQLAVSTFGLQLLFAAASVLFLPRRSAEVGGAVLFSLEASLSVMTIILGEREPVRNREPH